MSGEDVQCDQVGKDRYGRTVACCAVNGFDLDAEMVRRGWAVDLRRDSNGHYAAQEQEARDVSGAVAGPEATRVRSHGTDDLDELGGTLPCSRYMTRSKQATRPSDIDKHVAARVRERRRLLGLSLEGMAQLIDVTFQQAQKYETGGNRIAAARLYVIARALGVDVSYFFEGLDRTSAGELTPQQEMLFRLMRHFIQIPTHKAQAALCAVARALADPGRARRRR